MNINHARELAKTLTNEQIKQMFDNAKQSITDWTVRSICNKGLTKGVAWNILASDFDVKINYHYLSKRNMIREFGEFLQDDLKIKTKKVELSEPIHQEPKI